MSADVPAIRDDEAEVLPLAQELARAYKQMVTFYRDQMQMSGPEADKRARGADDTPEQAAADLARIRDRPPDQASWFELTRVADRDPEAAADLWRGIGRAARDELDSGHRVAQVTAWQSRPWDRARFLAIRDSFRADYQPRGGIEAALLDTAAHAYGDYLDWSEDLSRQAANETMTEEQAIERYGAYAPSRLTVAERMEQSSRMAERAHTRFLRTIKTLSDLRRAGPVFVGTAGQVNVGQQQVNVSHPAPTDDE